MTNATEEKKPWKWLAALLLAAHLDTDDEKKQIETLLVNDELCLQFFDKQQGDWDMLEKTYRVLFRLGNKEIYSQCLSKLSSVMGHYLGTDILDIPNEYVYDTNELRVFFRDFLLANGPRLSQECKLHPELSVKYIAWKVIRECTNLDTIPGAFIKFDKYIFYYNRSLFECEDESLKKFMVVV